MKPASKLNFRFFFISFLLPTGLVLFGFGIVFFLAVLPYTNIKVSEAFKSPVVPEFARRATGFDKFSFSELKKESASSFVVKDVSATFALSIPKLRIKNAKVETNSTNLSLDNELGHYKGTALPREIGNGLIYGHSALPIFYNPRDYKTIFSLLPELERGDKFSIEFSGKGYTYEVIYKEVVKPVDVNVFDSNPAKLSYPASTITLFTCVPPGSKSYRILVVGILTS